MKSEFPTHRNLLLTTAGLSFLLILFGSKLDFSLPILGAKLPANGSSGAVLLVLLIYFASRCLLDWTRLERDERIKGINRFDLYAALLVGLVAFVAQLREVTPNFGLWRLPIYVFAIALVSGEFIAATLSVVVFSLRFVRTPAEALRKALPRIPNAVRAQFKWLWIDAALAMALVVWIQLGRNREEWPFAYALVAMPILFHAIFEGSKQLWGNPPDHAKLKAVFDQHDAHYQTLGMSRPAPAEIAEATASATDQEFEQIKAALAGGYSPDTVGPRGWTPLMMAAANGDQRLLELFIEYGGDVNAQNSIENCALHYAAGYGNLPIIQKLLEAGAEVNPTSRVPKTTPLIDAVRNGHLAVVEILLSHGADPYVGDWFGNDALNHAEELGLGEVAKAIRTARRASPKPKMTNSAWLKVARRMRRHR